VLVQTGC